MGHFGIARPVRPSVPWRNCLGYRYAGCLQLSHRRPPEMCGLRTRPRTDVDPPRFLPPSNCHRRGAYLLAAHPRGDTLFLKGTGYLRTVLARYWHCPHNKRSGVYKTVQCPSCLSVCPYVCTIRPLQQRAAGLLLSSRRVGDVDRDRCTAGAAAARRSAANAGSATFSAYAGRRTQTWGPIYKISYDNLTIILR